MYARSRPATPVTMETLLAVMARRGLPDAAAAARALRATLHVLGECFVDDEALALAEVLPEELARIVDNVEYDGARGTADLYDRVGVYAHTSAPRATEHAQIVLAALGELIDHERRSRFARALPDQAAEVLLGRGPAGR
jgi:uncharacterized protein (DUF2267 family)